MDIYIEFWVILLLNFIFLIYYVIVYYQYKKIIHSRIRYFINWFVSLTVFSLSSLAVIVCLTQSLDEIKNTNSYSLFVQFKVLVLHMAQVCQQLIFFLFLFKLKQVEI